MAQIAQFIHGFPPIESSEARALVLGTMPGKLSLQRREYYAHPRNLFWRIMGELLRFDSDLPYQQKTAALIAAHIAVWDVLKTCTRDSSLDSDIDESTIAPNEFRSFLDAHQRLDRVFFNGAKAEALYHAHAMPGLSVQRAITYTRLPSTSPANAGLGLHEKLRLWREVLR